MTRAELVTKTDKVVNETHDALKTLWDNINQGQKKQLIKRKEVKELLVRYGVIEG